MKAKYSKMNRYQAMLIQANELHITKATAIINRWRQIHLHSNQTPNANSKFVFDVNQKCRLPLFVPAYKFIYVYLFERTRSRMK